MRARGPSTINRATSGEGHAPRIIAESTLGASPEAFLLRSLGLVSAERGEPRSSDPRALRLSYVRR